MFHFCNGLESHVSFCNELELIFILVPGANLRGELEPDAAAAGCNRELKYHNTYNGPVHLTYVDTGVYEGGNND